MLSPYIDDDINLIKNPRNIPGYINSNSSFAEINKTTHNITNLNKFLNNVKEYVEIHMVLTHNENMIDYNITNIPSYNF